MTAEALVLQSSPIMTAGYVLQVIIALVIVVGLIYIIARFVLPKMRVSGTGRVIQVVDRVMIEPQVAAYILKVGKKSWLIAASNKNIEKIADLGEEPLA
jgi:flagellar biogenesis protein FliO